MPNSSIDCPFCSKSITSTFYLKHIFSSHFESLIDPKTEKGKQNRFLIESSTTAKPISFYLPGNQENNCCLHCMVSCVKRSSALKHFEREECRVGHVAQLLELKKKLEEPSHSVDISGTPMKLDEDDRVLALCSLFMKRIDVLESENKHLNIVMDKMREKGIDIHEFDGDEESDIEEEEMDIVKTLDFLAKAHKWTMTRAKCNRALLNQKSSIFKKK